MWTEWEFITMRWRYRRQENGMWRLEMFRNGDWYYAGQYARLKDLRQHVEQHGKS